MGYASKLACNCMLSQCAPIVHVLHLGSCAAAPQTALYSAESLYTLQVERPDQLSEIVPQKRLADKVSGILSRIEAELDAVDEKIGERMHILDLDNDGLVSCVIHPTYSCPTYGFIYSVWRWRPYCCS